MTALDAVLARFLLNFFLTLAVFAIVTYSIIWWYELRLIVDLPKVALSMTLAGMLALAVGTFNAVIFMAFPTYENIWAILTRPMMILSGVLFLINSMPRSYADILWWNPVAHPIAIMRGAFYPNSDWKRTFTVEKMRATYSTPLIMRRLDEVEKR